MNTIKNLEIGDILVRNKGGIFSQHYAVYLGNEEIAENQVGKGVHIISLAEFLQGEKLNKVKKSNLTLTQQQEVLNRVESLLGKKYNLLTYNCEHFVNQVVYNKIYSKQVLNAIMIVLIVIFTILYWGNRVKAKCL